MTWRREDVLPLGSVLILSSFAFINLMALPAFEDEGSQLRLIWRLIDAGEWLQPLSEGKPFEAWLMAPLARTALSPLLLIRAVHVLAGTAGAALTYRLALQVSNRSTAAVCGALFAICPFVVYLQRLAHADILLCAAGVWTLSSVIAFMECATWARTVILALALLVTALCKLPVGFFFIGAMPLALVLMGPGERKRQLHGPTLMRAYAAHAPVVLLAFAVTLIAAVRIRQGHSPGFGLQDFMGVALGAHGDIAAAVGIARPTLFQELAAQLTWPVVLLGVLGLCASACLHDWRQRWLLAMGTLPMAAIALFAHFWYSRYLLVAIPPLIVAATCGWRSLAPFAGRFGPPVEIALLAACATLMAQQSARLIGDPLTASWSRLDRFQYLEGWGSGYGYAQAADFILRAPSPPRIIYSLDGHSAYQLRTYLPSSWGSRITPVFYAPDGTLLNTPATRLQNLLSNTPVWIIVSAELLHSYLEADFGAPNLDQLELRQIVVFDRPGMRSQLGIYEVARR